MAACRRRQKEPTLSTFTADTAAALGGPGWLRERRIAAAKRFEAAALPTAEEEVWRYSRIDDLVLDEFEPAHAATGRDAAARRDGRVGAERPAGSWRGVLGTPAAVVEVHDGLLVAIDVDERRGTGLEIGLLADRADGASLQPDGPGADVFVDMNAAFAVDPVVVSVPRGVRVEAPVYVHVSTDAEGVPDRSSACATFPQLIVVVGEGASLTVLEHHTSSDGAALTVPVTDLRVARGGQLQHLNVQELGSATWQLGHQVASVGQEATLVSAVAGLGGAYARLRTDCRLVGRGATGTLLAVYFGEGDQMLDFRTFQDHRAPDTTSNLLFKGAVGDHSRSVYTGLIKVRPEGRGTNAFQTNRNVKLSEHAWAESVPNLEIENNDVRCSHASAVGPIDEEQRFYLESRGVRPDDADRLIVAGFFDEVVEQIPVPQVAPTLRARIAEKLDRRDGAA